MLLILLLTLKHFVCDFLYQPPYMFRNKGTYGHLGGIAHASFHGVVTMVILFFFVHPAIAIGLAVIEGTIHYHIDWFKMWYNAKKQWGPSTHNEFWVLLGVDQLLHYLTYIALAALVL